MTERVAERFAMMYPVYDTAADDPILLEMLESHVRGTGWDGFVERAGGTPYSRPDSVEHVLNHHYGLVLKDDDGTPILGEDGQPLVDRIRLHLVARGWAYREPSTTPA
jgi:hypothetical protein